MDKEEINLEGGSPSKDRAKKTIWRRRLPKLQYFSGQLCFLYSCALFSHLNHNQICHLMFHCGCLPMWNLVWPCNILTPGPVHMKCPWCQPWVLPATKGWWHLWFFNSAFDTSALPVLALYASSWKYKLFTFIGIQIILGKFYQWYFNYPYFLGFGEFPLRPTPDLDAPMEHHHTMESDSQGSNRSTEGLKIDNRPQPWMYYLILWSWGDCIWVIFYIAVFQLVSRAVNRHKRRKRVTYFAQREEDKQKRRQRKHIRAYCSDERRACCKEDIEGEATGELEQNVEKLNMLPKEP